MFTPCGWGIEMGDVFSGIGDALGSVGSFVGDNVGTIAPMAANFFVPGSGALVSAGMNLAGVGGGGGGLLGGLLGGGGGGGGGGGLGGILGPLMGMTGQMGSASNSSAALDQAAMYQQQAALAQIAQAQAQQAQTQRALQPFTDPAEQIYGTMRGILGLRGDNEQQFAMKALTNAMVPGLEKQGEQAILQNASATGGLRGGNVQAALAKYRPQLMNDVLNQQMSRLMGMANLSQNSILGVASNGQNAGNLVNNALGQQGAVQAGNALGQSKIDNSLYNNLANAGGALSSYLKPAAPTGYPSSSAGYSMPPSGSSYMNNLQSGFGLNPNYSFAPQSMFGPQNDYSMLGSGFGGLF